jgi:hypothetical protein
MGVEQRGGSMFFGVTPPGANHERADAPTDSGRSGRKRTPGVRCTAALCSLAIVAVACKPGRSVNAFCATFRTEATRLHDKYQAAVDKAGSSDPIGGFIGALGSALQSQGDLTVMFQRLDDVAPEDIEPDVAAMRDAFRTQAEATRNVGTDPLGALGAGLITGLQSYGSQQQVDAYLRSHCDLSFEHNP